MHPSQMTEYIYNRFAPSMLCIHLVISTIHASYHLSRTLLVILQHWQQWSWVTFIVLHNNCNMGTCGLPHMFICCLRAAGPRDMVPFIFLSYIFQLTKFMITPKKGIEPAAAPFTHCFTMCFWQECTYHNFNRPLSYIPFTFNKLWKRNESRCQLTVKLFNCPNEVCSVLLKSCLNGCKKQHAAKAC